MCKIKVVRREGKKKNDFAEWLDVNDIVGMYSEGTKGKSYVVYKTSDSEYIDATGVEMTMTLFEEIDGFIRTDRGVMANLKKIESIDEKSKVLYFGKKKNQFFTIAASRWDQVKEYFCRLKNKCDP